VYRQNRHNKLDLNMTLDQNKIVGYNLKRLRMKRGLTQQELAHALGFKNFALISNYERGTKGIGKKMLKKLAEFFGVPYQEFFKPPLEEKSLQVLETASEYQTDYVFIPLVEGRISAGRGLVPDTNVEIKLAFRRDWIVRIGDPANMSLIRVEGDSMEPTLYSGDIVLVDHNRNFISHDGGIYAIVIDDSILIKRLQVLYPERKIKVISDNPRYEPFIVSPGEIIINGKIIWFARMID